MIRNARNLSPLEQREKRAYTYRAIGEAVGVHLHTVAHWVEVAQRQGKRRYARSVEAALPRA
jgi:transposase